MRDIILKLMAVAITEVSVILALHLTGAHGNSTRFSVVLHISEFAVPIYFFSDFMADSIFQNDDNRVRVPAAAWKFLAIVLGIIGVICFFTVGNGGPKRCGVGWSRCAEENRVF